MMSCRAAPLHNEDGAGLVALPWSILAFGAFLMLAVQVAVYLFGTSIVTANGHEATRQAALGGGGPHAVADAERWLRSSFGSSLDVESTRWTATADTVALDVVVRLPSLLPDAAAPMGLHTVERRFEARRELARFAADARGP